MDADEIIARIRNIVELHEQRFYTNWELFEELRQLSSKAYTEHPKKGEIDSNTGLTQK
jgi:hypothetical protein